MYVFQTYYSPVLICHLFCWTVLSGGQLIGKNLAGHRSMVELNLADNSLGDVGGQVCSCMRYYNGYQSPQFCNNMNAEC